MEKENTAIRLKKIMNDRNLRQVDILNLTEPYCKKYGVKMNKSDISQYCSGKTEPNQNKLFVLGIALNVNEAWLMGYDVPMERTAQQLESHKQQMLDFSKKWNIRYFEKQMLESFSVLTDENKKKSIEYTQKLLTVQKLEEEQALLMPVAAHERTDIEVTDEMRKHDDDLMDNDDLWK